MLALLAVGLLAALFASAVFSGGETGLYSLARWRVDSDAERGVRSARTIQRLLRDEAGLLATILIGNNLANELGTHFGQDLLATLGLSDDVRALAAALLLTPLFFFFGELLPKDLHRRRPHAFVGYTAPGIAFCKGLFLPLSIPLRMLSTALGRLMGLGDPALSGRVGPRAVVDLIRASAPGSLGPHVEELAQNVLGLRRSALVEVSVPWRKVDFLRADAAPGEQLRAVRDSRFTRLPILGAEGRIEGYVHQLDVLAAGPEARVEDHVRELIALPPRLALDRALVRMRAAGARAALVGTSQAPLGFVTLKDIVEEISGELARW